MYAEKDGKYVVAMLKSKLDMTNLSDGAKEELSNKAKDIYLDLIANGLCKHYSEDDLLNVSNEFACDDAFCAAPKQLLKTPLKLRKKVREITGISPVWEPDARADRTITLLENTLKYPVDEKDLATTKASLRNLATDLMGQYIQKYSDIGATVPGDSIISTAAAYYFASNQLFYHKPGRGSSSGKVKAYWITQEDIAENLGISEVSIRNRYKDIIKVLDL